MVGCIQVSLCKSHTMSIYICVFSYPPRADVVLTEDEQMLWLERVRNSPWTISEWWVCSLRCELTGSHSTMLWLLWMPWNCIYFWFMTKKIWFLWFQSLRKKHISDEAALKTFTISYKSTFFWWAVQVLKDFDSSHPKWLDQFSPASLSLVPSLIILVCIHFGCLRVAHFQHLLQCWAKLNATWLMNQQVFQNCQQHRGNSPRNALHVKRVIGGAGTLSFVTRRKLSPLICVPI